MSESLEWERIAKEKGLLIERTDSPHPSPVPYQEQRKPMGRKGGLTEVEFTEQVIDYAQLHSWRTAHFRAARTEHGWRTAVSGDGKGFVDLVLVRERVIWAELKTAKGRLSPEQAAWRAVLLKAGQEVYLWKPTDWERIESVLAAKE